MLHMNIISGELQRSGEMFVVHRGAGGKRGCGVKVFQTGAVGAGSNRDYQQSSR